MANVTSSVQPPLPPVDTSCLADDDPKTIPNLSSSPSQDTDEFHDAIEFPKHTPDQGRESSSSLPLTLDSGTKLLLNHNVHDDDTTSVLTVEYASDTDSDDDSWFDDIFDSPLNSIITEQPIFHDYADVLGDTPDLNVLVSALEVSGDTFFDASEAPNLFHDDNAPCAQIDTGAFASVTGLLHILHDYKPFTKASPCPLRLLPATDGSDTIPLGFGYLHVPANVPLGYIPV